MGTKDKRVDAYIAKAPPFAKPLIVALREIVHATCPDAQETIKWSRPAFDYNGSMCGLSFFKAHFTFGFWLQAEMVKQGADEKTLERLGRMETIQDLPPATKIAACIKKAMALNDAGVKLSRAPSTASKIVDIPDELAAAFAKNKKAKTNFDAMSPSGRRDYCEWVVGAKREETRAARVEKTVAQVLEGKSLNWKYERK